MAASTDENHSSSRAPLTRDRVLRGAVGVADADGLGALTIRSLATALGVKPMAIYHHVANKDEILDGIVDAVFAEMDLPAPDGPWRAEIRRRSVSARDVLRRHPWAVGLLETRTNPGPATLRSHEAVLATLRGGGFDVPLAARAFAILDSYVYGFVVQEAALPFDGPDSVAEVTAQIMEAFAAGEYPHMVEMATEHVMQPGYAFGNDFEFGLDLILDGLERALHGA
ncbi:MAG: TetR/AcrR family transcriptional regulator C-terminal domain-containing protein [Actinomycetota bacterium]|nr:TetR/AcrR family transcriptional regulator C-terminal domain-containing protein [Actinomycetota bacterium]